MNKDQRAKYNRAIDTGINFITKTNLRSGKTEKFAADNGNVIASIAHFNGFLTDTSVKENLRAGLTIYTSFNKYRREG